MFMKTTIILRTQIKDKNIIEIHYGCPFCRRPKMLKVNRFETNGEHFCNCQCGKVFILELEILAPTAAYGKITLL